MTLNLQYPESCSVKFFHEKDEKFEIISSNDIIFADDNILRCVRPAVF